MSSAAVRPAGAALLVCLVLVAASPSAPAAKKSLEFDPNHPEDALQLSRKMLCSLQDGKPTLYWWKGSMLSRVPGERDRVLFNVQGMNIRQCGTVRDEKRGLGYRSVSREVMLYLDPETNQVLRKWKNPWTGEEVDVVHVANDPVNMRSPQFAYAADGTPHRFRGQFVKNMVWTSGEAPLWYDNPLAGDYQEYVGNNYLAIEALNAYASRKDLLDRRKTDLPDMSISWARVSDWIPWMKMRSRAGVVVFTTVGRRVASIEELSEPLRSELKANYPQYLQPPPLDDTRPNETSWTYIKKIIDAQRAGRPSPAPAAPPATPAGPDPLRTFEGDDVIRTQVKISCSLTDGKPTLYWWSGKMFARVPGEPQRHLFNVHGMNIRQCASKTDPVRGFGYRSVSREVMLYLDPETNQVLRKWKNPWTGKEVDVVHVANDPVNLRQWAWTRDEQGQPVKRDTSGTFIHGSLLLEGGGAARLFYKNPLGGDFQDYVGGNYQAMEFGSTAVAARQALDPKAKDFPDAVLSWGRISRWLPWMEMGDRDGLVFFHTAGMRLDSWDQLPDVIRKEIELNYPQYREPPPIDDARPNETSWTVFKRFIEEKRAKEAATAPKN